MASHDDHAHRILSAVATNDRVSQRSLANNLGIALGLTNLLMRRLSRKGWVRIVRLRPNRVRYMLTPAGIAERARMSREALQRSVKFYAEARNRIRDSFAELSSEMSAANTSDAKRIVFFGAGEVAEIGYVCLQETDLQLVGVIDESRGHFFGMPVTRPSVLTAERQAPPFDRVVVMSFADKAALAAQLAELGISDDQVFWI
jgi:DNA-binding MarR family transcriptional regulator